MKEKFHINYFSESELKKQYEFKTGRTDFLNPVIKILDKLHFTPNSISYIGLFLLAGFLYFMTSRPYIASIFLLCHIFIDAFDGSLARYQKKDGNGGAFVDIMCDHTGIFVVVGGLIYSNLLNALYGYIYLYVYTIMIIFVIIRNVIKKPIKFVFRSKYFIYIFYGIWVLFNKNYLDLATLIFILLMIHPTINSYYVLMKYLNEKK